MGTWITMAYMPDGAIFRLITARDGYDTDTVFMKEGNIAYVVWSKKGYVRPGQWTLPVCGTSLVELINDS